MQFDYNGTRYAIRFAHSPPLNPDCHRTHEVYLTRKTVNTVVTGPTFLVCRTCSERYGRQIVLAPVAKRNLARLTWCEIMTWRNEQWEIVSSGVARPRTSDDERGRRVTEVYSHETGRRVALKHALVGVSRELRAAAHYAYENRRAPGKPRTETA